MNQINTTIRKAVFPIAGLGTRFLPATKASPKEMLPVVNKPLIQYAVEEAYAAGIRQMIFVTCHNKRAVEDHFDLSAELETVLVTQDKMELMAVVKAVTPKDMECCYVRQPKPLGLGHAVLCAEHLVGNESFAVLLADDLLIGKTPVMKQMIDEYKQYGHNIIAVQEIPIELSHHYGIIQGIKKDAHMLQVEHLVEKPQPEVAPSNIAIVGRYILSVNIFDEIRALPKTDDGEIQLTDAIKGLLKHEQVYAYRYEGERFDCGSILGFLKANVVLGRAHPSEGENFSKWLFDQVNK